MAIERSVNIKINAGKAKQDLNELAKSIDNVDDESKEAARSVGGLNKSFTNAAKSQQPLDSSIRRTNSSFRGLGRNAGQASIQVQQLVGQVSGGVSPFVAFSQQAADLGFVLGVPLLGAVTSIAAVIIGSLVPSLFDAKQEAGEFTDELIKVIGSVDDLNDAQRNLVISDLTNKLEEQKEAAREARESLDANRRGIELLTKAQRVGGRAASTAAVDIERLEGKTGELTREFELASATAEETEKRIQDLRDGSISAAAAFAELEETLEKQVEVLSATGVQQKILAAQQRIDAELTDEQKGRIAELVTEISRLEEKQKIRIKQTKDQDKSTSNLIKTEERARDQARGIIASLEQEFSLRGLNNKEKQKAVLISRAGANATAEEVLQISRLVDALDQQDEAVEKAANGFESYAQDALDATDEINSAATNAAKSIEDAFVEMATTGKLEFSDLVNSILADIARIQVRKNITGPLSQALSDSDLISTVAGFFGFGADANAKGGAYDGGVKKYARGGIPSLSDYSNSIVSSPTMFATGAGLMGEAGPEAILPLTRTSSGNLGVESSGMGGVKINIINQSSGEVKQESITQRRGPNGETIIDAMIVDSVKKAVGEGRLDKTFNTAYGIRRQGT